jgi:acetyl esterase/lipase
VESNNCGCFYEFSLNFALFIIFFNFKKIISMKVKLIIILLLFCFQSAAQQILPLYDGSVPNSKEVPDEEFVDVQNHITRIHQVSRPTITVFLPPKEISTGEAVIICPGGGYWILAFDHEGIEVAKKLNEKGIAAFVLKYRLPHDDRMPQKEIAPLQDAQRAIQLVRSNSRQWGVKKDKIGILGFSAGGHLASTAGTQFEKKFIENKSKISLRPDFMILVYPVISFSDGIGHSGSMNNLLGKDATAELKMKFSNELNVTKKTPPTFLVHAKDDPVKIENSFLFLEALQKKKVKVETLFFEEGGHGFGLKNRKSDVEWADLVAEWIKKI